MDENLKRYLRAGVRHHLRSLLHELGHYEQTTHGSLAAQGDLSLKDALAALAAAYDAPGKMSISEADQRISAWLAREVGE